MTGTLRRGRHAEPLSLDRLSPRERDVLDGLVRGLTNKAIGMELGISHRTVEIHRARVMRKLNASSIGGLLATAQALRGTADTVEPSP